MGRFTGGAWNNHPPRKPFPTRPTAAPKTDLDTCGYTWIAPHLQGGNIVGVTQRCREPKEHDGNHVDVRKIYAPNTKG